MPVKVYRPTTAGRRKSSVQTFAEITKFEPEKSLVTIKRRTGGRNNQGKITVRHRGGGAKRYIRMVDFKRMRYDEEAEVIAIEYDPNRSAFLALIQYADQTKAYMIAPEGLKVGTKIMSSQTRIEAVTGNRMPLEFVPQGVRVHNIEFRPGEGGKMARGAGTGIELMNVEGKYAQIKLPSGEIRMVPKACAATIGVVGNADYSLVRWGKAGRTRLRGIKPTVRGKAMNPVDHPHGGGEGRNPIGMKHPKTPWGKPALGVKTRRPKKGTSKFIVKRRGTRKRK